MQTALCLTQGKVRALGEGCVPWRVKLIGKRDTFESVHTRTCLFMCMCVRVYTCVTTYACRCVDTFVCVCVFVVRALGENVAWKGMLQVPAL